MDKEIQKNPKQQQYKTGSRILLFWQLVIGYKIITALSECTPGQALEPILSQLGLCWLPLTFQECSALWNVVVANSGLRSKTIH